MKQVKRIFVVLVALIVIISCAVTCYAVSASAEPARSRNANRAVEDYAAEEMAISDYYEGISMMETVS